MSIAVTGYGVDLRVQLGIGRQADRAVWDSSRWDTDAVWGASETALGDWVDVTCDVDDPFTLAAGASDADGIVTRWEAATLGMTLWGNLYDPWDGPHAGTLGPQTPVRVLWRPHTPAPAAAALTARIDALAGEQEWVPAFTGAVAADGYRWTPAARGPGRVDVDAVDATSRLVAWDAVPTLEQGAAETASSRVGRILDIAYWPEQRADVHPGGVRMRPTRLEGPAWSQLLAVADTDLALLWVDREGVLCYRPQGRVGEGTRLVAHLVVCPPEQIRDEGDVAAVQVVTMGGAQPADIRNVITVTRRKSGDETDDTTITVRDEQSIARYQAALFTTTLQHHDQSWSAVVAAAALASMAWPTPAPRTATLDSRLGHHLTPQLLLALEPDMTFDVTDPAGRTFRQAAVGWTVDVGRGHIRGDITLDDVTRWVGGRWDQAGWDQQRWGFAMVTGPGPPEHREDNDHAT